MKMNNDMEKTKKHEKKPEKNEKGSTKTNHFDNFQGQFSRQRKET